MEKQKVNANTPLKPVKKEKKTSAPKNYVSTVSNLKRKNRVGYLFLLPWIIGAIIFAVIPAIITIYISLAETHRGPFKFEFFFLESRNGAGRNIFANYISMLSNSKTLLALLDFISVELLYVPVIIIMSFILAIILTKNIKARVIFRTIFFFPVVIISGPLIKIILGLGDITGQGSVSQDDPLETSFIFRMIFNYSGVIAKFINTLFSHFVIILWLTGIPIILFINAINKINKDLYEAARIDGANSWQMLWKITIPNCRYISFVIAAFSIVQISTLPLVVDSEVESIYTKIQNGVGSMYDKVGTSSTLGLTAAYSVVYFILIILLIGLFALVLLPRQKKSKEVMTLVQIEQLRDTKNRNKHLFKDKKNKGEV